MIRDIVRDTFFLSQPSVPAERNDVAIAEDLVDTLKANADRCVGLAANMIGERKCIIAIRVGHAYLAMLNPVVVRHAKESYEVREGCLSLAGERSAQRYAWLEVEYRDLKFRKKRQVFRDFPAEIVQHELDHCAGVLI
ncbi:peptide deformylase [Mitsuokella jalaludinii]|uniref:peptide deformylase n=1 Tax=Mitsuokella jalaludinii TaxID=187979 RepID=UPI0029E2C7A2|nr:peptide deformylase [Selenomonadaceae bacterium]